MLTASVEMIQCSEELFTNDNMACNVNKMIYFYLFNTLIT